MRTAAEQVFFFFVCFCVALALSFFARVAFGDTHEASKLSQAADSGTHAEAVIQHRGEWFHDRRVLVAERIHRDRSPA